ncbi:MAG: hypothetical protein LBQ01_00770 [Prevotellaceae bacterium]|jgi:hypothetical protein|nr:hypothetical protein [Prevotellaceae bacterium]
MELSVLQNIRRWHGGIDDQFAAIDNLVSLITDHQPAWTIPAYLLEQLIDSRNRLQAMINHCRTNQASRSDRELQNTLLKSTVGICAVQVKIWARAKYAAGVLTADDVHLLGFLLPGETGGHDRIEATGKRQKRKLKP